MGQPGALVTFDVFPDGGEPFELGATSRDVARWERMGKSNTMAKFESNPAMADLELIAFIALDREVEAGRMEYPAGVSNVQEFRERCDIVPQNDEEGVGPSLDPFRKGR